MFLIIILLITNFLHQPINLYINILHQQHMENDLTQKQKKYNILKCRGSYLKRIHWVNTISQDDKLFFKYMNNLQDQKQIIIQSDNYYRLVIESTYLIFTAQCCNINIQFGQIYFDSRDQKKQKIKLYLQYIIENKNGTKMCPIVKLTKVIEKLFNLYFKYNNKDTQYDLNLFQKQFTYCIKDTKFKQFRDLFLIIQQSQLFRKRSIMTKLKNCMLITKIQQKDGIIDKIKKNMQLEVDLANEYDKMIQTFNSTKAKEIQKSFSKLIQKFWSEDLIGILKLDKSNLQEESPQTQYNSFKFCFHLAQKQFIFSQQLKRYTGKSYQKKQKKNLDYKRSILKYFIQISLERGLIIVTLRSDYQVNIQTLDKVLYMCNQMVFQIMSIQIQPQEKKASSNTNNDKTMLLLTGKVQNARGNLLYNTLILIDTLVIVFKIFQQNLQQQSVGLDITDMTAMLQHYVRIVQRCNKNLYSKNL